MLFNLILDTLATRFVAHAVSNKWGTKLEDGTWVSLILFADKYWLVATKAKMLKLMTVKWLDLMDEFGWETPVADLTWCSTVKDNERRQFKIMGGEGAANVGGGGF